MKKTSEKELYGLIGYPVKHSFSHLMHNAAFAHYKMDAVYQLFEVAPDALEKFFKDTIFEKKFSGFNVTVPHKENAVQYLNGDKDNFVKINSAVNTVRVEKDGRLSGVNTDGLGFLRDLNERGVRIEGKSIALIGAGGGAKAVATAIASESPEKLFIFDVDRFKTERLLGILKEFYPQVRAQAVESLEKLDILGANILINATPVGMKESDPLLVKKEWLHEGLFVYDLIYNPQESKLLKTARECGCLWANGLGMLLHQGALAFETWTGKIAPLDVMRGALSGGDACSK
jgi:shikimate dehydrogenase